ncbi:unnamed protein product [Cylindrotheca closterium]|uniref:Calmodulin n=1 Tax=Cylindrotheca closterium TaxID=2856 RepID=A0AAD2FHA6_9STRA|nr:unnamed protein product [Cylindrotheca closterium]
MGDDQDDVFVYDGTSKPPKDVERIKIDASLKAIPHGLFDSYDELVEVDFSEAMALESIGNSAFANCDSLKEMHLSPNVKTIGKKAFENCYAVTTMTFGDSLEFIGESAFVECMELTEAIFPSTLTVIEKKAFEGCEKLKQADFSKVGSMERMEESVFARCSMMKETTLPTTTSGPVGIENFVYTGEGQKIPQYVLSVKVDLSVVKIDDGAFEECQHLREVDFSEAILLEEIGTKAFMHCNALKELIAPQSLTKLGNEAFSTCGQLLNVDLSQSISLTRIPTDCFYECKMLKKAKLPPGVKIIAKNAFGYCESLDDLDLYGAKELKFLGEYCFDSCQIGDVKFPPKLDKVGYGAFSGNKMKTMNMSEALMLQTLPDSLCYDCKSLTSVHMPPNLEVISEDTFSGCKLLADIHFPKTAVLKTIMNTAFAKCASLLTIEIPRTVTNFGTDVFQECSMLISIDIAGDNLALAIRLVTLYPVEAFGLEEKMEQMYSLSPIKDSELLTNESAESKRLQAVKEAYVDSIIEKSSSRPAPVRKQHGWVQFLANHVGNDAKESEKLISFIKATDLTIVRVLANAKDLDGRLAMKFAKSHIRSVFEERLLFLGRYDLASGPPIHKSATCIVVKAEDTKMSQYYGAEFDKYSGGDDDNPDELSREQFQEALKDLLVVSNDSEIIQDYVTRVDVDNDGSISRPEFVHFCLEEFGKTIVLKFMRRQDQYLREIRGRDEKELDKRFVVGVIGNHDENNSSGLVSALGGFLRSHLSESDVPEEYKHVIVMPFGDRNLDTIFRSERPDTTTVRTLAKEIGEAVAYLHKHGLLHGDLKMLNVVRINGHLALIDLDASAQMGEDFAGAKYSSGVLPPEMIYPLVDFEEKEKYISYFKDENEEEQRKRAPKFSTSPTIRGYAVRSFLEEEIEETFVHPETGKMVSQRKSVAQTEKFSMYDLVLADSSFDVWSFGVLLYTMCSKEPLFRVNNDDDITDGNSMRQLHHWGEYDVETVLERNIQDNAAKALLKRILQRDPEKRPSMENILKDDFFHPGKNVGLSEELREEIRKTQSLILENRQIMQNGFSKIHESLRRVTSYQEAANSLLKEIIEGGKSPKYFVILPVAEEVHQEKRFSGFLSKMKKATNPSNLLKTKARLCFICPISLEPVLGTDGEAIGYDIDMPRDWIKKYGPAILIGLKIVQVGLAIGRGFGLPLPSLSGAEEELLETSDLFAEMQGLLVDEMGGDEEEDGLADILLENFTDRVDSDASAEGPSGDMTDSQRARLQDSYDGIGSLIDDEGFKDCGLVQAFSKDGTEYVHPDVAPLFEEFGSKCFEMSIEEMDKAKAKLAARAREENGAAEKRVSTNGDVEIEPEIAVSEDVEMEPEIAVSLAPLAGSPKKEISEQQKEVWTNSLMSTSADSAVIAHLENMSSKLTKLEGLNQKVEHIDFTIQHKLQGIPQGSTNVVHKGWLCIRSRRTPLLWNQRYVVVYKNGSITHYPNGAAVNDSSVAGSTFTSVKWIALKDGTMMELCSEGKVIANAKLSRRSSSTIADWLQGNIWVSSVNLNRKAAASRTDATGNVIKIETAGG